MARMHASSSREKHAFSASFITYETFCKSFGVGLRRTIHQSGRDSAHYLHVRYDLAAQ